MMNKNIKILFVALGLGSVMLMSSCKYTCDLGYEGDHCTDMVRTKYIGTFTGNELCASAADSFAIAITEVTNDVTKIRLTNLHNANNQNAIGTVLENGAITIAPQVFGNGGNINGTVTIVNGKVNVAYVVKADGVPDAACTWVQN